MARPITQGDIDYAQSLLRARTADARIIQALTYRGIAAEVASGLLKDLKAGRPIKPQEFDPAAAQQTRQGKGKPSIVSPQEAPGNSGRPATGVRLVIILPPVLALAFGLGGYWWWKAAQGERAEVERKKQAALELVEWRRTEALKRVPDVVAKANDFLRSGQVNPGLRLVDDLLLEVDAPELQDVKIDLLAKGGRVNEAYNLLLELLQRQPDDAHLHFKAGVLADTLRRPADAAAQFGEACGLVPENKAYRAAWAKACLKTGDANQVKQAVVLFKKLLEADEQSTTTWLDYASALYASGQRSEAISLLTQAVRRFPEQAIYHFALAKFHDWIGTETGDSAKLGIAASYYLESLRLRPMKNSVAGQRYYEITGNRVPPEYELIRTDEIALERRGNSYFVYASINGVPGRFLLDTGATSAAIPAGSLNRFNLAPTKTGIAHTAAGLVRTYVGYADITIGKYTLRQARVGVMPVSMSAIGCDGLLGLDSLRGLGAQLDTTRGLLIIQGEQPEALFGN